MKLFALVAFGLAQSAAATPELQGAAPATIDMRAGENAFEQFKEKFGKVYKNAAEELKRFKVFLANMDHVAKMATVDAGAKYSVLSPFADETPEEFYKRNGFSASLQEKQAHVLKASEVEDLDVSDLPSQYDAREEGLVGAVKNQAQCGSCWAFATVANIEGQNKKVNGELISLSEQELVDCSKSDMGCNGGLPSNAYKDLLSTKTGLELEEAYSYTAATGKCHAETSKEKVFLSSWKAISSNEDQIAAALVKYGPLAIGINAQYMQFYMGGVSDPFWCPASLDHGVTIVGFGEEKRSGFKWPWQADSVKYWIIRNSWGASWGEKGYYRIMRGSGKCGLNKMVTTALVAKKGSMRGSEEALFI